MCLQARHHDKVLVSGPLAPEAAAVLSPPDSSCLLPLALPPLWPLLQRLGLGVLAPSSDLPKHVQQAQLSHKQFA